MSTLLLKEKHTKGQKRERQGLNCVAVHGSTQRGLAATRPCSGSSTGNGGIAPNLSGIGGPVVSAEMARFVMSWDGI